MASDVIKADSLGRGCAINSKIPEEIDVSCDQLNKESLFIL